MFQKLTTWFGGRHTTFIFCSFATGIVLSIFKRLDANMVALILGLAGYVFMHSVKEDHYQSK